MSCGANVLVMWSKIEDVCSTDIVRDKYDVWSQMSIILMSEVGGKPSILLMKMVVMTSMVVRFTLKAASKKKGLKKVVAKVIAVRRREGK